MSALELIDIDAKVASAQSRLAYLLGERAQIVEMSASTAAEQVYDIDIDIVWKFFREAGALSVIRALLSSDQGIARMFDEKDDTIFVGVRVLAPSADVAHLRALGLLRQAGGDPDDRHCGECGSTWSVNEPIALADPRYEERFRGTHQIVATQALATLDQWTATAARDDH
jgi:hypothetical protein